MDLQGRYAKGDRRVITEETLRNIYDMHDVNLSNAKVMWFSTSDDVLPLLESGSTGTLNTDNKGARAEWFWCRENGVPEDKAKDTNPTFNGGQFEYLADFKHCYQKAGVYFSLMSELKYMKKNDGKVGAIYDEVFTNIQLKAFYRYQPKCGSERISSNPEVSGFSYGRKLTRRPYEDVTGLHKFEFHSTYTYEDYAPFPSQYVTVTLRPIIKGY